jgi:hypothetical protein
VGLYACIEQAKHEIREATQNKFCKLAVFPEDSYGPWEKTREQDIWVVAAFRLFDGITNGMPQQKIKYANKMLAEQGWEW